MVMFVQCPNSLEEYTLLATLQAELRNSDTGIYLVDISSSDECILTKMHTYLVEVILAVFFLLPILHSQLSPISCSGCGTWSCKTAHLTPIHTTRTMVVLILHILFNMRQ